MPSPATPRRTPARGSAKSTPTKSKALDIGKPLGVHDTNSVREKVRLWQQKGGGVVTPKDPLADKDDDKGEENKPTEVKPEEVKPEEEPEPLRVAPRVAARVKSSQNIKTEGSNGTRKRSQSTPRKRVISDQHWRKQRSPPTSAKQATKGLSPKRLTTYKTNEKYNASSSSLPERSIPKKDHAPGGLKSSNTTGDGIRVYPSNQTPRSKSRVVKTTKYVYKDGDSIIEKETAKTSEPSVASSSLSKEPPNDEKNESSVRERFRRTTPPPEDDDDGWARSEANFSELSRRRRRGPAETRNPRKAKGGILNQVFDESRKMFAKPAPPPQAPVSNRGDKIADWLSGQPDPFVNDGDNGISVDMPAPLKTRSEAIRRPTRGSESSITDETSQFTEFSHSRRSENQTPGEKGRRRSLTAAEDTDTLRKSSSSITSNSESRKARPTSISTHSANESYAREPKTPTRSSPLKHTISTRDSVVSDESSEVSASDIILPLRLRKPFPSTGLHRLSTIASEETLSTRDDRSFIGSESKLSEIDSTEQKNDSLREEERDYVDPNSLSKTGAGLRRKLTKHEDLMSVLSNPKSGRRSIRSTRSIRSNRTRLENATIEDLMKELTSDETKYLRELRTLVGGVIPVLLSCVLSRSDSAVAAGLFRPSADPKDEATFTRPIVDMGVALERLKNLHKRIPLEDCEALLGWAQGAQRVYRDYLKAWRMGFQDVVVNLAPLDEEESAKLETQSLDQGMERDENGDVIDSNGEKVDVAYLLKRPLVRLKYLSKTFKGIDFIAHSPKAEQMAEAYKDLVDLARRRSNEERARLEDESAACVDDTRARDPETLKVLTDLNVNKSRRVLARDFFNLSLLHSSGQTIDCHAELLLRDNAPGTEEGGDLLICEIDDSDRWLLFPPIETRCVSARSGSAKGEIVLMIRGYSASQDREWRELLSLTIDDEDIRLEWVRMLGLDPVPPTISRSQSFLERSRRRRKSIDEKNEKLTSMKLRLPSPSEVDVPIGEQGSVISRAGNSSVTNTSGPSTLSNSSEAISGTSLVSAITRASDYSRGSHPTTPTSPNARELLPSAKELSDKKKTDGKASPGLKRTKANRRSRHAGEMSPIETPTKVSPAPEQKEDSTTPNSKGPTRFYENNQAVHNQQTSISSKKKREPTPEDDHGSPTQHRLSSVPSMKMPSIPKIRQGSGSSHSNTSIDTTSDDDQEWPELQLTSNSKDNGASDPDEPPPPPLHRSPSQAQLKNVPILSPSTPRQKRRSSSPLKHEYEPSSASDTSSESDSSTVRHYDMGYSCSDTSDTSDEELEDDDDIPTPLPPVTSGQFSDPDPPASLPALDGDTLSPSNSASQGPYRSVPSQPSKSSKAIASIFHWAEQGKWEGLVPGECSIIVTPGLIEAYELSRSHPHSPENHDRTIRPLIALELTPLVPIRRGTAIDISIRSPPTERSKIRKSNNIMFRSRNLEECEVLYSLINQARINNPTYIALQNARGPYAGQPVSFSRYDLTDQNKSASWFGFPRRKNSYRASKRAPSIGMASESSVGTMSSAFSALKRFGTGNKIFSIARSTITSRTGSRDGSTYSRPSGSGLAALAEAIKGADGIGLSNAKIRLYHRESTTKWRDLGAARLTIMPVTPKPSRPNTAGSLSPAANPNSNSRDISPLEASSESMDESSPDGISTPPAASPRRVAMSQEKRILIHGKTAKEILLDVCLGETSFERVARTGIAVSVWEDRSGGTVQHKGGVTGGAFRIYMIQMKSEAEAAYTFGLVGKLRY